MAELSKEQFRKIMDIIRNHQWLCKKADELTSLLFEDCNDEDDVSLIVKLLSRFKHITTADYVEYLENMVSEIVTMPFVSPENTILVAMAADSSPDSSQALVQLIKVKLQQCGWSDVAIVNTFGVAFKNSKKGKYVRNNIILIDEFIGTGKTALNRVNAIKEQFSNVGVEINIFVKVMFSSVVGVEHLRENKVDFWCDEIISRGITDFNINCSSDIDINRMLAIERKLAESINEFVLSDYSLGYGKTESLISLEDKNTPNNVFPIFWWPKYFDGHERRPILTRWFGGKF